MASKTRNLTVCGLTVPFDSKPRFSEVEAYDAALKEGGQTFALIQHMAPVIVNARLRPETPFKWESHTPLDQDTAVGVLEVVEAIREALSGPKVAAALERLNGTATPSR